MGGVACMNQSYMHLWQAGGPRELQEVAPPRRVGGSATGRSHCQLHPLRSHDCHLTGSAHWSHELHGQHTCGTLHLETAGRGIPQHNTMTQLKHLHRDRKGQETWYLPFAVQGNLKSFTRLKSSPVTIVPWRYEAWVALMSLTCEYFGHTPDTSSPSTPVHDAHSMDCIAALDGIRFPSEMEWVHTYQQQNQPVS